MGLNKDGTVVKCDRCQNVSTNQRKDFPQWRAVDDQILCHICDYNRFFNNPDLNNMFPGSYKPRPEFKGTTPTNLYIGMELETEVKTYEQSRADIAKYLTTPGLIYCKYDGSLVHGIEIVTHPMSFEYFTKDFIPYLKMFDGLDVEVCSSAERSGMHFHVSRNAFTEMQLYKFLRFHHENQHFISFIGGRQLGRYCRSYEAGHQRTIRFAKGAESSGHGSYVNTYNADTIELRYFKGNLNMMVILKNVEFIHALYMYVYALPMRVVGVKGFVNFVNRNQNTYPTLHSFLIHGKAAKRVFNKVGQWEVIEQPSLGLTLKPKEYALNCAGRIV
jgi:hypothetical protein